MAESAGKVNNHDIVGVHVRINRFIVELQKSASSAGSEVTEHDQARLESYLAALDTYHAWIVAQPQLDCPETHPREYTLQADPEIVDAENESINDAVRLLVVARDETVNSQSARQASGLKGFDSTRLTSYIEKVRRLLEDYIKPATALDLPESSPQSLSTGSGLGGI